MPDIKEWLVAAAGTLSSGEVVKPPSLSYLEAMNALQMMDPAMDWGTNFAPKGEFDPSAALSPAQLVWVMDEMAARELAWHRGGTMAQTLFTSLHYHNALDLAPNISPRDESFPIVETSCVALRAFVLAYAKSIELAYYLLLDGGAVARDGEDIWLDPYGIPLDTTESPEEVVGYVEGVIRWLLADEERMFDPAWGQIVLRLRFRKSWIEALQLHPTQHAPASAFYTSPQSVPWAFDAVTPFLRQSMPLPSLSIPGHSETWEAMTLAASQLESCSAIVRLDLERREQFLRTRVVGMLPIVRTLYKTILCDVANRDEMVDEWLTNAGHPRHILAIVDAEVTGPTDRRSYSLWRDIVAGTLALNLTTSLCNPSRRRRALSHLSRTWSDQAAAAARLSHYPQVAALIPALHARALDAELHAAILAWPLGLVSAAEARMTWWWILLLAKARKGINVSGWERRWAGVWAAVASGMLLLYTALPVSKENVTLPQFVLRHKIVLGTASPPLKPTPSAWNSARTALDANSNPMSTLPLARAWLEEALKLLPAVGTRELDIAGLKSDLAANIEVLKGAPDEQVAWVPWSAKERDGESGVIHRLAQRPLPSTAPSAAAAGAGAGWDAGEDEYS